MRAIELKGQVYALGATKRKVLLETAISDRINVTSKIMSVTAKRRFNALITALRLFDFEDTCTRPYNTVLTSL